jgi:hypothetical protein
VRVSVASVLWASDNSVLPHAGGECDPPFGRGFGGISETRLPASGLSFNLGRGGNFDGCRGRGRDNNNPSMFNPWTGLPTRAHIFISILHRHSLLVLTHAAIARSTTSSPEAVGARGLTST